MFSLKLNRTNVSISAFRKYLIWLCFGLVYFLLKMLIAPQDIIDDFIKVFLLNLLFLTVIFLVDRIANAYLAKNFTQFLVVYFLAGFSGLFLVDWLVFGNYEISNIIAQLFMFSYWSGAAIFPKLIIKEDKREGFYFDLSLWLGAILGLFVCIGGLAYFFLQRPEFWQVSIMLFFITLNLYYWREFLVLRHLERTPPVQMAILENQAAGIVMENGKNKAENNS